MDSLADNHENISDRRMPRRSASTIQLRVGGPATDQPVPPGQLQWWHDQSQNNAIWDHSKQTFARPHERLGYPHDQSHGNAPWPHSTLDLARANDPNPLSAEQSRACPHGPCGPIDPDDNVNNVLLRTSKLEHPSSYLSNRLNPDHLFAPNTSGIISHNYANSHESPVYVVKTFVAIADEPTKPAARKEEPFETSRVEGLQSTQSEQPDSDSDKDDDLDGHALMAEMSGIEEDFHPAPHIRDTDNEHRKFTSHLSPFE